MPRAHLPFSGRRVDVVVGQMHGAMILGPMWIFGNSFDHTELMPRALPTLSAGAVASRSYALHVGYAPQATYDLLRFWEFALHGQARGEYATHPTR